MQKTIYYFLFYLVSLNSSFANATTLEFFRWQSGEFMAALRYIKYGEITQGVNDIYAREIGGFNSSVDVSIGTICPRDTGGTITNDWTFFGARFLPLLGTGNPSFYVLSYLGGATGFHNGKGYDSLVTSIDIRSSLKAKACVRVRPKIINSHIARFGLNQLSRSGHYAPMSWNSLDIDGDGIGDFTLGGVLYLSSDKFSSPIGQKRVGAEAAFIRIDGGIRLARLSMGKLVIEKLEHNNLVLEEQILIDDIEANAGHALTIIPGRADGLDRISIRVQSCGLRVFDYDPGRLVDVACINGLTGSWALPGARGDFDSDGIEDFWISQTNHGQPVSSKEDHVSLISGSALRTAKGIVDINSLTVARVNGSDRYTDYDGIATTLSPFAGDVDGDALLDLTFSGHRHMNESGALYILPGSQIKNNTNLSIDDPKIIKIVGPLMGQLAPPYHHWDATDWDVDGYDDIVITADNDLRSGANAGAVYIMSGKKIFMSR